MRMIFLNRQLQTGLLLLASVLLCLPSMAADRISSRPTKIDKLNSVGLFSAMQAGQIEVQFIPKNSKQATVLVRNNTKKPLTIQLPAVFAGVPVLHQFGGGGMGGGGMGGMGGGGMGGGGMGGGQGMMGGGGMGGGMGGGGMGGGMGGGGMGGGMFNLAPEKVRKLRFTTVCLEHGKKEPNPRTKYVIIPIEMFPQKAEVIELGKMLSTGKLDQTAAQAAVWHYTNGMSWNQLANKVGVEHLNGTKEPYFQRHQLNTAIRLSAIAQWRARNLSALQQTAAKPEASRRNEE